MRLPLIAFLLIALVTGLWQRAQLSRLASREKFLREDMAADSSPATSDDAGALANAKSARRGTIGPFGPPDYVKRLVELMERHSSGEGPPPEVESNFVLEELTAASPRQLKELVILLRQSPLPEGLAISLFGVIAPCIAESDPEHAAELAWEGGEWGPFRNVLRSWISRDPAAAATWLEQALASAPVAGTAKFRALGSVELQALALATRLANDPAGDALDELLRLKGNPKDLALEELARGLSPEILAVALKGISRHEGWPLSERLQAIGSTLARHPDPATARQILLDAGLAGDAFVQVAEVMFEAADPVGRQANIAWAKTLPDLSQREELLRLADSSNENSSR